MRRRILFLVLGLAAVLAVTAGLAAAGPVSWGTAVEVPGTAALNLGGQAQMDSVSCRSTGNCTGGGTYYDQSNARHVFVVGEKNGVWGNAVSVPIPNWLSDANVRSVSCGSVGNCAVGGYYNSPGGVYRAFLLGENSGVWTGAIEVPGTAALNTAGFASLESLSCTSTGNCSGVGHYFAAGGYHVFDIDEVNGTWGSAFPLPGMAALGHALPTSISCASPGNCAAGGYYYDQNSHPQAFVVNETNGVWQNALEVPGTAVLNVDGAAEVASVSCGSAGNCSAGGYYTSGGNRLPFVVTEKAGVWGAAATAPGIATLNNGYAAVSGVSCHGMGNCSADGYYSHGPETRAFVVSQKKGVWGKAIEVPGLAPFNGNGTASAGSISCASAGNCAVVGFYTDKTPQYQTFVARQKNWIWGKAVQVPGTGALNKGGDAGSTSVSCVSTGRCAIAGYYYDLAQHEHASVTTP